MVSSGRDIEFFNVPSFLWSRSLRFPVILLIILSVSHLQAATPTPIYRLLGAIRWVETGDKANPPAGDHGRAIGPFQIHYDYWRDSRVPGRWADCHSVAYSERVVIAYWMRYVPWAFRTCNFEVLARVHNGGPLGYRNPRTLGYWRRVWVRLRR